MQNKTAMLLVVTLLCLASLAQGFNPLLNLDGKSLSHRTITQRAILKKTAEVCKDIAASEGSDFSLVISDNLSVNKVLQACSSRASSSIISSIRFLASIFVIHSSNAVVDYTSLLSAKHHFDDETFQMGKEVITDGVAAVKASAKMGNFIAGRWSLGRVCHTLQDFYSHSNWVELKNTAPYSTLIRPEEPLKNLAGPELPTCRSCTEGNCTDNLLPELMQQGLLTSGYFSFLSSEKPAGKCSHGGVVDLTSTQDPVGGINKDTVESSHGPLHEKAAMVAVNATLELLEDIRAATGDINFLRLMGLSQSPVLCFVIDTTGSMADDIAEAKRVSFKIIDSKRGSLQEPSSYILVPFNDPGFGPLFKTTDADLFKDSISRLTASGGGDTPELSMSGLLLALTGAPPSSEIFVFTDAPAKDANLGDTVIALIESTKSVVTFMLTDVTSSKRRRRNVSNGRAAARRSEFQLYHDLARASGGQTIEVTKSDLSAATSIIEDLSSSAVVTVLQVVKNPGAPDSFSFTADESLQNLTIYITGTSLNFTIVDPTGASQTSNEIDGPLGSLSVAGNLHRLSLHSGNQTGSWEISVASNNSYSIRVTGLSPINFLFQLLEENEGGLRDFFMMEGRLLSGGNATMMVTMTESESVRITEVNLADDSGRTRLNGSLQPLGDGNFLVRFSAVPAGEYVVRLKGEYGDAASRSTPVPFERQALTRLKTSSISLTTQGINTDIEPGSNISVPFLVTVITNGTVDDSATGNFTVRANNDRGFNLNSPSSVELGEGGVANGTVILEVPADAVSGTDVTLTIEVEKEGDLNYAVLRLSVTAKVTDISPPVCAVVSTSGNCPSSGSSCASSRWELTANVTDGSNGTGVERIAVRQGNGTLNTSVETGIDGENVTVVTYEASCCSQSVEMLMVDGVGNVGKCEAEAPRAATTETPVVQTTSSGGRGLRIVPFLWVGPAAALLTHLR